jgi:hypothetical protein
VRRIGIDGARSFPLTNLTSITRRFVSIPVFWIAAFMGQARCTAESLALDPFTAKVTVYGVSLDPAVKVSADVSTTRFAVHPAAEIDISANTMKLTNDMVTIAKNALPKKVQGGPCEFEIQSVSNLKLSVAGNTGFISVTANVIPARCPLSSGQVTVAARFIPIGTSTKLGLKVFGVQVQVPWWWKLAGGLAGQNPETVIQNRIAELAGTLALNVPKIDHLTVAFQGANLDSKGDLIILGVRSDALIDKQAITSALTKWDAFRNFQITYP